MAKFLVYLVYIESAEENGYIANCPQLPGCVTQGETIDEAMAMMKDAIGGYIASLRKHGDPLPSGIEEGVVRVEVVSV